VAGEETGLRGKNALYKLGEPPPFVVFSGSWVSMARDSGRSFDFHGVAVNLLKKALVE
jgi:hypothetical protein